MAKTKDGPLAFKRSINGLVRSYKDQLDAIVVQTVQEVSERIVTQWPVDTGYSRAAWWTTIDGSPASHPEPPTPGKSGVHGSADGQPAISPQHTFQAPGHVWGMKNSAVYSPRLEYGHSAQAPSGVVRVVLAQMPEIVGTAARQIGAVRK